MTAVPNSERRTRYAPVSPTTTYSVGFVIYGEDDVTAFVDGVERATGDATYPWSLNASFIDGECADAAVVFEVGLSGVTVDIVGKVAPSRVDQFADGAGIPAADLNLILNRIVAAQREIYDLRLRVLAFAFGELAGPIPDVATRANMVLAFDAAGQPTVTDLIGDSGWSPVFSVVSDSLRRVLRITDWQGGEGTKPATGLYVGATGLVSAIASGVDIRGAQGASGAGSGDMVAANNLADVANVATARTNLGLGALAVLSAVADGSITLAKQANLAEALVIGRAAAAGTGVPQALTGTQLLALLDLSAYLRGDTADQTITGGARITSLSLGTIATGTVTPDPGDRPMQHYTNGGAHTLAPGANPGSYMLDITNNGSAGVITISGWTKVTGSFDTTNAHKFRCHASIGNGGSLLSIQALQ